MKDVLWIGGPPGSGKTSAATRLARRHGLRIYSADTRTWAHRDRALAAGNEAAQRWEVLSPDARHALAGPDLLDPTYACARSSASARIRRARRTSKQRSRRPQ